MPLTEPLSGFFADEYNRFMMGLQELSGADQERRRRQLQRMGITPETTREMSVPQWGDVVHITARTPVTSAQRDEWRASRREQRAPNLPPDVALELARRTNRVEAFRRSLQPEFSQSWGAMMTATDNVQDFLSSVSVGGRVVTKIGQWLFRRSLPGVGWVQNAADLLSLGMFFGNLALPAFAAICNGPRAALAAGVATALVRGAGKGLVSALAGSNPLARRWRVPNLPGAAARMGVVGSALVIAQTTDQLTGYGISLGPLVGYTIESVYLSEARWRGQPVRFAPAPESAEWWARAHPFMSDIPTPALQDRGTAAGVLYGAPTQWTTNPEFTFDEHVRALIALHVALPSVLADVKKLRWDEWRPDPDTFSIPAPRVVFDPVSSASILDDLPPESAYRWPMPGAPARATVGELAAWIQPRTPAVIQGLLAQVAREPMGTFLGALWNECAEGLALLMVGDPHNMKVEWTPDHLALERMLEQGLVVNPNSDEGRVWAFWREGVEQITERRQSLVLRAEWLALADKHQVDLIYLKAPNAFELEEASPEES